MFKLVLEKAEKSEIKLPTSAGSWKKQESSRKTSIYALLTISTFSTIVDHNKLWETLKEMGIPDHVTCLLRNLYAGQEATVRTRHGKTDWFQIEKDYLTAVYCHPAYLTYMQSTSWKTLGWIARRNINNLRYADDTTLMSESKEELKSHLMKAKEESEKLA